MDIAAFVCCDCIAGNLLYKASAEVESLERSGLQRLVKENEWSIVIIVDQNLRSKKFE